MLAAAKRGEYPDGRTKLGKSLNWFCGQLKESYGESWTALQELRVAVDVPVILFYLTMPVLNTDNRLLDDFKWAHNALERLIKDVADLAGKKPKKKIPTIEEVCAKYNEED